MAAVYGTAVLALPYDQYFRLWLNLDRQLLRKTHAIREGVEQGVNGTTPTLEQYQAVTRTDDEAETIYARDELERSKSEIFRDFGFGFGDTDSFLPSTTSLQDFLG